MLSLVVNSTGSADVESAKSLRRSFKPLHSHCAKWTRLCVLCLGNASNKQLVWSILLSAISLMPLLGTGELYYPEMLGS